MSDEQQPSDPVLTKGVIHDLFKETGFLDRHGPKPLTANEEILMRAGDITKQGWTFLKLIMAAEHDKGAPYDRIAAFGTALKFVRDEFAHWSKEDLEVLATIVHAEFLLTKCDDYAKQLL